MKDFIRVTAPGRDRLKMVEYWLPRLVKRRKLKARKIKGHANKLFYALPGTDGRNVSKMEHGLKCTEALIRFHLSEPGEYISERDFRAMRFKPVPEFAVRYGPIHPTILLFEYSTADNFRRKSMIDKKIRSYVRSLDKFEKEFDASPLLVYVIDAADWQVEKLARKWARKSFYFASEADFYSGSYEQQLDRPIYRWGDKKVNLYV
jgi:hypothetical protein